MVMTNKILLFSSDSDPPVWWTTLLDHIKNMNKTGVYLNGHERLSEWSNTLDSILEESNLRFTHEPNTRNRYIEFENKEDLVMFILRWS